MSNRPPRQLLADQIVAVLAQLVEQVQRCFRQATGGSDKVLLRGCLRDLLGLSRWSEDKELHPQLVLLERLSRALFSDSRAARERVLLPIFCLLLRLNDEPRRQLAVLLRQRLDLLAAMPVASVHEPWPEQVDLLHIYRGLRRFLPPAGRHALAVDVDATQPGLEQLLQQRLQALATACSRSNWTLTDFALSGMARQCRELTQLGCYAGTGYRAILCQLEAHLLSVHARGQRPAPALLQQLLVHISGLALGKVPVETALAALTAQPAPTDGLVLDTDTLDILRAELGRYGEHLHQELTPLAQVRGPHVSELLLLVSGKLVWVLHAVGQRLLSELAQCLNQVYLQYWSLRLPLPAELLELSASFRHALAGLQQEPPQQEPPQQEPPQRPQPQWREAASVHGLMSAVLVHWPSTSGQSEQTVSLPSQPMSIPSSDRQRCQALPLREVPGYLATTCNLLLAAEVAWFMQPAQFFQRAAQLQQELRLLEQGMAAMKMQGMEEFSALLLDVYTHLRLKLPSAAIPGPLLWQAQQQLILMLDRTAAGLAPLPGHLPDADVSNGLTHWLAQADARLARAVERQPHGPQWLELKVAYFLRQTSKLLGRPLRLCLQQGEQGCQLRPLEQQALVTALFTLLRWTLLGTEADMALRRKAHKPLAIALGIELALDVAGQCWVTLSDDSSLALPDQKQLARLEKTAGALVHSLRCSVLAEQLRCFSFQVELIC